MEKIRDRVAGFAERRKIFRARDAESEIGVSRTQLRRYVESGLLENVSRGVYALAGHEFPETQSLLEVSVAAPKAVVCLLSALEFHGLTTQAPTEVWIAIDRTTRRPKIDGVRTRIFRFTSRMFEAGIEKHIVDGVELRVYSAAKTVADCFRHERTIGLDVAVEALRSALRDEKATVDQILEFAELRGVRAKIMPFVMALTL